MFDRVAYLSSLAGLSVLLFGSSHLVATNAADSVKKPASILEFRVNDIDGKEIDLAKYQGKVLMVVNTASQCGYTPQYEDLEAVYEKFKNQGFEILAFPSNEFGAQEPGSDLEIKEFCSAKYHVTFPLFSKIVVKGKAIHPLYDFLTGESTNPRFAGPIPWNFTKFVVNRKGEVIGRFQPGDKPSSPKVLELIEKSLSEK